MKASENKTEFVVIRNFYLEEDCPECGSSGVKTRTFRKMTFKYNCENCKGEGKVFVKHSEEVLLSEALKQINQNEQ